MGRASDQASGAVMGMRRVGFSFHVAYIWAIAEQIEKTISKRIHENVSSLCNSRLVVEHQDHSGVLRSVQLEQLKQEFTEIIRIRR